MKRDNEVQYFSDEYQFVYTAGKPAYDDEQWKKCEKALLFWNVFALESKHAAYHCPLFMSWAEEQVTVVCYSFF